MVKNKLRWHGFGHHGAELKGSRDRIYQDLDQ